MSGNVSLFLFVTLILNVWEVKSEIDEKFIQDLYNIYTHVAIEASDVVDKAVTQDDVRYFLFTKENPENYTEIDPSNSDELVGRDVRIVFIIHGWIENREKQWYEELKNAFLLKEEEYYVVQVDWSDPAHQLYTVSSYNTRNVGNFIGEFVVSLHKKYSIPLEHFLVVGHSLGGQVSGFVGKKVQELLNTKLPRIVALDPAGPLFTTRPEAKRLNRNDAEVVQVIHTDGGTFGFKNSCGTIDFFPNGGSSQPGCTRIDLLDPSSVSDLLLCDHQRSWQYFIEAVLNPEEFLATKCESWIWYQALNCEEEKVSMGDLKTRATGDFYLETKNEKPFVTKREELKLLNLNSFFAHL